MLAGSRDLTYCINILYKWQNISSDCHELKCVDSLSCSDFLTSFTSLCSGRASLLPFSFRLFSIQRLKGSAYSHFYTARFLNRVSFVQSTENKMRAECHGNSKTTVIHYVYSKTSKSFFYDLASVNVFLRKCTSSFGPEHHSFPPLSNEL